jgi:hypothetical protein
MQINSTKNSQHAQYHQPQALQSHSRPKSQRLLTLLTGGIWVPHHASRTDTITRRDWVPGSISASVTVKLRMEFRAAGALRYGIKTLFNK